MDANGTKFHLLLGKEDWSRLTDQHGRPLADLWALPPGQRDQVKTHWNEAASELTLAPRLFQFSPAPKDNAPTLENRRGAGRDRFGNWYWIDSTEREILVNSAGSGSTSHFWSECDGLECEASPRFGDFVTMEAQVEPSGGTPALPALKLRGLAVTEDHYLVVGVLDPAGLLIFDLHAGGSPRQILWPEEIGFAPFDMSPRPGGGVWILDRDFSNSNTPARYWALDRHFSIEAPAAAPSAQPADFQPVDGGETRFDQPRSFAGGVSLETSSPPVAIDAIAIEALPDDTILILDRNHGEPFSLIRHYDFEKQLGASLSTEEMAGRIEKDKQPAFTLRAHDFAFAPASSATKKNWGTLYIVEEQGNQSFAFTLLGEAENLRLGPLAEYLPMRLFAGRGLVRAGAGVYYDFSGGWVPLIEQRRPRFAIEAVIETPIKPVWFDGLEPDCVWHRLMLDACIPPETRVEVWSRAANEASELPFTQWQPEPNLYSRSDGSEQPFARKLKPAPGSQGSALGKSDGTITTMQTWELLFQRARGRFLQLRLRITGNGRSTPRLRALRAYYPRFSYLEHYLPGVYREDEQSASFLDRFLSNFEGFYTALEDKIASAQMLFDVRSAPAETLEWLASWLAVVLDPAWDERKRRLFIKHAMTFFQYRGTIRGLQMSLRLALEDCADESMFDPAANVTQRGGIRIIEAYRSRRTPGVALGDPTELAGLREISPTARWTPENGRADLNARYKRFFEEAFQIELGDVVAFPIRRPEYRGVSAEAAQLIASGWEQFARETLGFVPSAADAERNGWDAFLARQYESIADLNSAHASNYASFEAVPLPADQPSGARSDDWSEFLAATGSANRRRWQNFLERRYRRVAALNQAYGKHWKSLDSVPLFDELPPDSAALQDWYRFEAVLLAMQRAAHRFTVLLPAPPGQSPDTAEYQHRRDLAARIVNWEKPAHTVFDVKFFWNMFRVGGARLGEDTVLDLGSRAPQLMSPMTLGQGHLAEAYLAPTHPQDVTDRQIIGRDRFQ
ncbi:MAG: phage tail protein [Acidobacteriota bacterium]